MTNTELTAGKVKAASVFAASSSTESRNRALTVAAEIIERRRADILAENSKDVALAKEAGLSAPLVKRLVLTDDKISALTEGLLGLVKLEDPNGKIRFKRELDEGLVLSCVSCPIGVIGVVFEARPEALVQIAGLCIKSGNCAILKGGREATLSNRILFEIMRSAVIEAGLNVDMLALLESREEIAELLSCDKYVDLLIPRGSNSFVRYIMDNTNIPVMGHAAGVCHIYIDKDADVTSAAHIVCDAKTQYPAACNAVETVLVHRDIAERFAEEYKKICGQYPHITVHAVGDAARLVDDSVDASEDDFGKEFSDNAFTLALVDSAESAIMHINTYGSGHTDCIITENDEAWTAFSRLVDSAGVYRNCSTRFSDGFRYGFGAEVGISTSKIHARGPVGLEGLVTYKYLLEGSGQTVCDYANGKKKFTHKDL
ncbi:MAG: glutamate-5-semialdehyde dehydrogenase [Clostridia bacterium]|nr:glutamate-5-semialdehyde dehydrogenase [Clostridia bacterium]